MKLKMVRCIDRFINIFVILCLLPIILFSIYSIWDENHIYQQADSSLFEMYKPTSKDDLSFKELQKINPEVFGWITVKKTHIDYPLVQGENNSKYVNTDVKGEFSLSGSIFLDCHNKRDFSNMNNIIYGHHMQKKMMFGELDLYKKKKYFNKHLKGTIYFDNQYHKIEFFAFISVDAYDPLIYTPNLTFENDGQRYLEYIKKKSINYKKIDTTKERNFIALSTCTSSSTNGRYVLVGYLK